MAGDQTPDCRANPVSVFCPLYLVADRQPKG